MRLADAEAVVGLPVGDYTEGPYRGPWRAHDLTPLAEEPAGGTTGDDPRAFRVEGWEANDYYIVVSVDGEGAIFSKELWAGPRWAQRSPLDKLREWLAW
jgi:hypothetical protein